MKNYLWSLEAVLLTGALILGMGAVAGAQQAPPASQQPMEIPAQYPSQPQGGPQPQGQPQQAPQNDPGAARISFIQGDVSTQHNGSNDWTAATVNTPVVEWRPCFHGAECARRNSAGSRQHPAHERSVHRKRGEPSAQPNAGSGRARPGELRRIEEQRFRTWRFKRPTSPSARKWAKEATASR